MKEIILISAMAILTELGIGTMPVKGQSMEVIEAAAPSFPRLPPGVERAGEVAVTITIDPEGLVTMAKAHSGPQRLRQCAETASLRWKFAKQDRILTRELIFAFIQEYELDDPPQPTVIFKLPNRIEVFEKKT